jgi:hypothetical protein
MNRTVIVALVVIVASLAGIGAAQQTSSDALEPTDHLSTTPPVDGNLTISGEFTRYPYASHYLVLDEGERVNVTLTNLGPEAISFYIFGGARGGFQRGPLYVAPGSTGSMSFEYNPSKVDWPAFEIWLEGAIGTEYEIEVVSETDRFPPTPTPTPEPPTRFQIDFVEGEPIERLDPEAGDTYHRQDRLIHALHIAEDENHRGGFAGSMWRTYESRGCEVTYTDIGFRSTDGRASVWLKVWPTRGGDCENITLSLVGYELPEGTTDWDPGRAAEQELKDSMTRTLTPGDEIVYHIHVIDEEPPTPTPTPIPTPAPPTHYQIDFVEGEPIERLNPETGDTYHRQDRFITALHVAEDDSSRGGPGGGPGYLPRLTYPSNYSSDGCKIHYTWRSFNGNTGKSRVDAMVEDVGGCEEITLTYAGYELPEGTTGWDADRADEQELKDSMTRTLAPGDEMTFIVYVFDEEPTTTGTFDVVDVSAPDVSQGETANVTATIENTGDTAGTQRVSLSTEGAAARGASKLDIVFVVDDSANVWPEMEDAKEHVRDFSSQLGRADVDARYALVSFTDEPEVDQAYTSDVSEFQDSVDRLTPTEDSTYREDAWDAIRMALELEAREDSTPVVILITDAPAYSANDYWYDFSDLTRSQVASLIDDANASLITVTSLESSNDVAIPQRDTTALAGDVADGTHFDLVKYDYGGPISDEIAAALIERSRTRAVTLALAPGESARVSYSVSTDDVPPGTYNITVATANDSGSTTLTVTN